jgi:hypothetical protein
VPWVGNLSQGESAQVPVAAYIQHQFCAVSDYIDQPASGQFHGWTNAGQLVTKKTKDPQAFCMDGDAGD